MCEGLQTSAYVGQYAKDDKDAGQNAYSDVVALVNASCALMGIFSGSEPGANLQLYRMYMVPQDELLAALAEDGNLTLGVEVTA